MSFARFRTGSATITTADVNVNTQSSDIKFTQSSPSMLPEKKMDSLSTMKTKSVCKNEIMNVKKSFF